eukprot:COSAG01_NODE_2054_length_8538_cov_4.853656_3_plen_383_part_00
MCGCVCATDVTPDFPRGARHDQYTYGRAPWFYDRYHRASAIGKAMHPMHWTSEVSATRKFSHGFVAANGDALGTVPMTVELPAGETYTDLATGAVVKGRISVSARNATVLLLQSLNTPRVAKTDDASAAARVNLLPRCLVLLGLMAVSPASWSHPGWWAKQGCPRAYSPDRNHVLCIQALPPALRSYQMNRSTIAYFIGNASGTNSAAEIQAEARFGYMGVGWQLDGIPRHWKQGLEVVELAAARQLKARQPGMRVLVSRQTEVGTVMWNSVAALRAADPKNKRGFWTSCRGKPCAVKWETDSSFFFNWNSAALRDWWVYEYIGAALNESLVDGVYLDCACRAPEGDHLNQGQFQANAQLAVNRAIALATSRGKTILTCACM